MSLTLRELGLKKFNYDQEGLLKSTSTANCPVSAKIPMTEFLKSQSAMSNTKAVPVSAHQAIDSIQTIVGVVLPGLNTNWGEVFVYRDQLHFPNYVDSATTKLTGVKVINEELPIEDMMFTRMISRIPLITTPDFTATIAVKWENKEIQIGCGLNVKICDNFNILNGELLSTSSKMSFTNTLDKLEEWLGSLETRFNQDLQSIVRMQNTPLNEQRINVLLGAMMQNYHRANKVIALTEVTAISQQIVEKEKAGIPTENLWDFTNRGTEVLRFDRNSGESILENIKQFNSFVLSKAQ